MGKTISFKFLTAAKQREVASLQSASIYKQINTITRLHEKVKSLQHIIHHVKQRVQTLPASVNLHPHAFVLSLPGCQQNMSTNKKEIVAIVFVIVKFQNNLFIKRFLLRMNCKSVKEILPKHVPYLVSKQILARWQAILSAFDFEIEFIKGVNNSLSDFLTREFLQGESDTNIPLQEHKMSSRKPKKDKVKPFKRQKIMNCKCQYKINLHL